ncbi:lamin tail domain-containing protein [Chryseobacterium sp. MIQD13]|uniref:lamin tail domain-containing protein n=1 Tax=Chryseobacterium sp. MIQD13 TaxID=3422310 RepID=UPI003D2CCFAC
MKLKYFLISFFLFLFNIVSSQLMITEVYFNTPFNEKLWFSKKENGVATGEFLEAYKHHRGEFIEIYNYSDKDIYLNNWYIQDYIGTFRLPHDKLIKSGQFMVIAYSTIHTQPPYLTEFPALFPTTAGKESQIILQDQIILRNKHENVKLMYSFNGFSAVNKSEVRWEYRAEPPTNFVSNVWMHPNEFYAVNSIQYNPDPNFNNTQNNDGDTYNNYKATPNPLDATYKPAIQSYESLVMNDFQDNYAYLDWTDNVTDLVDKTCPINIETVSQPADTSDTDAGHNCFSYDEAGNMVFSADCSGKSAPLSKMSSGYSADELEAIKNSIIISPNPTKASDSYNVNITWSGPALDKINNIQIFNSSATTVYGFSPGAGVNTTSFNLQNQLPGSFVANFTLSTGQVISKNILKW